jgi:DNA mismatch repair protein MutL
MSNPTQIEILPTSVVDQIAAGEVVERPAHLVKELLENSLDAGSTDISVEFSEGGRELTIVDNGTGISPKDLPKALARHATSKIRLSDDLWSLKTFGFRGEALASIAAVSRLSLSSKAKDGDGARLESEFGNIAGTETVGHAQGTRVQVSQLFANVPARLKFLRSQAAESGQIKSVLKALALAHPSVTFRVTQDGESVFLWPQTVSRLERAKQIFQVQNLYEGTAEREGVRAYAVFSDPHTTVKSSKQIWLFAQNRWIQDRSLQAAVMEAHRNLLMHGEYPLAAVWVEVDPAQIDVNIHPTKSQVKFLQPSLAFRAVQASLRDTLEKAPWIQQQSSSGTKPPSAPFFSSRAPVRDYSPNPSLNDIGSLKFSDVVYSRPQESFLSDHESIQFKQKLNISNQPSEISTQMPSSIVDSAKGYWSSLQVLGQAGLTYLICQSQEGIVFVDQHAAHERVLFERLMSAWRGQKMEVQEFLFPVAIDLTPEKLEGLMKAESDIQKLGITIEALGPATVGVRAAPAMLKESALASSLDKTAQEILDHGGSFQVEKLIGDLCALMACHSAIRAGQAQSVPEMKALLEQMDEFALSSFCPHGRPVSVNYSFHRLERDFGRIV